MPYDQQSYDVVCNECGTIQNHRSFASSKSETRTFAEDRESGVDKSRTSVVLGVGGSEVGGKSSLKSIHAQTLRHSDQPIDNRVSKWTTWIRSIGEVLKTPQAVLDLASQMCTHLAAAHVQHSGDCALALAHSSHTKTPRLVGAAVLMEAYKQMNWDISFGDVRGALWALEKSQTSLLPKYQNSVRSFLGGLGCTCTCTPTAATTTTTTKDGPPPPPPELETLPGLVDLVEKLGLDTSRFYYLRTRTMNIVSDWKARGAVPSIKPSTLTGVAFLRACDEMCRSMDPSCGTMPTPQTVASAIGVKPLTLSRSVNVPGLVSPSRYLHASTTTMVNEGTLSPRLQTTALCLLYRWLAARTGDQEKMCRRLSPCQLALHALGKAMEQERLFPETAAVVAAFCKGGWEGEVAEATVRRCLPTMEG